MSEPSVLDSSALLAVIFEELGSDVAAGRLAGSITSSVNLSETVMKLLEKGFDPEETRLSITSLGLRVEPFQEADAWEAARLRPLTRAAGLSFGDRACLALGMRLGLPVVTADKAWAKLGLPVAVDVIR